MDTQTVLFEDHLLGDMSPITLTRPAFAVTCACATLFEVATAAAGGVSWVVARISPENYRAALRIPLPGGGTEALPQRVDRGLTSATRSVSESS